MSHAAHREIQVLRVFPNPERFKTCYVEDWDERIKKVDRDWHSERAERIES